MTTQLLAFIRQTALLTDDLILSYMASQQIQISEHFAPTWGQDAICLFVTPDKIPEGAWQIWFKDHAPDAGEIGFHDDLGNPTGYVFVADALAGGSSWTVTASHETLELLADPLATRTVTTGGEEFPVEVADACEDDQFAKFIAGHHLTNFVLPSWFDPSGQAPFTAYPCAQIVNPYDLAEGGYIGVRPIGGQWSQRFASEGRSARQIKGPASRTMRRFTSVS
jgi:hypothetical protein